MKTKVKHGYGGCEAKSGVPAGGASRRRLLMPRRKTPRPEKEALAISKALRKRYISPEAEATAKRLLNEQTATPAAPKEEPFTASERERAAEILSVIRKKYPPRH
jgi:hypothetical protein